MGHENEGNTANKWRERTPTRIVLGGIGSCDAAPTALHRASPGPSVTPRVGAHAFIVRPHETVNHSRQIFLRNHAHAYARAKVRSAWQSSVGYGSSFKLPRSPRALSSQQTHPPRP